MTTTPTAPDHPDRPDRHLEIVIDVGPDASLSTRLSSALDELAAALAAEEVSTLVDEDELDDEVVGFSFGGKLGDIGFSPTTKGICISKNTSGTGSCGSWCAINTDGGPTSCGIDLW